MHRKKTFGNLAARRIGKKGIRSTLVGIFVNLGLALTKCTAGFFGHSFALIADGLESAADVITGLGVYLGLRIALRPPDENHPYGHGKAEPIAALVVGLALIGAAVAIAFESIHGIITPHPPPSPQSGKCRSSVHLHLEAVHRSANLWIFGSYSMLNTLMFCLVACLAAMAVQPPPQGPDVNAQREAMKKLGFFVGQWAGGGRMLRAPGEWIEFDQTEHGEYKLDGLLLVIEGEGRAKSDGRVVLRAYGIVSYDEIADKYHMRAFNDGRWLESDVIVADKGKELTWGFTLGEISTKSKLRLTGAGEWTESHDITIGPQPAKKFMELTVKQVSAR
jgi:hypothetical protein